MAILRDSTNVDDSVTYIATIAFFCCISCVTIMLKFGGFKATLNVFGGGKKNKKDYCALGDNVFVSGAYRTSKDEFFRYENLSEEPKNTSTRAQPASLRPVKSSNDVTKSKAMPPNSRYSNPSVSLDPRGAQQVDAPNPAPSRKELKNQEKEQKKLEKQRLAQQKAREKLEAQEQAKQEKLRREREKRDGQQAKRKENIERRKPPAPQPQRSNPMTQDPLQYSTNSTNTLESSISRTTGPPPYSEKPKSELVQNDNITNVNFSKPVHDTSSWDMVSQHREQINRPATSGVQSKQRVLDLNYNFGSNEARSEAKDNSEA